MLARSVRTPAAIMDTDRRRTRRTIAIVVALLLVAAPSFADQCPKSCRRQLDQELRSCKSACPKRKAGKACRNQCRSGRRAAKQTCRSGVAPTPPLCGAITPVPTSTTLPPTTSTTLPPATTPTTLPPTTTSTIVTPDTTTTTTLCVPTTCEALGAECGSQDDGCGVPLECGTCPEETPVCVEGT